MKTYLALGDSYTIGTGISEGESLPFQLAAALRVRGMQVADPLVIARNGWTTDELILGIDATIPPVKPPPFDLVTLLIGVNNQYSGCPLGEYRQEFAALLVQAIAFAGSEASRVIVLSIPDWSVTPFAEGRDRDRIAAEINAFNAVNLDETHEAGAHYVDITPLSRLAVRDPALLAPDALHPSGELIAQWVALLLPVTEHILR